MKELLVEPFQGVRKRFRNTIGITRAFAIAFHSGFYFSNKVSQYRYVLLFYGKQPKKMIAFQFLNDNKIPGALRITHHPKGNSGYVTAHSFFNAYGIDAKKYAGRYKPLEGKDPKYGKLHYFLLEEPLKNED
jgi:hypothetical protein